MSLPYENAIAEAEVYEALIHKAPIPAASHIPGFDDAPGGEVG